MTSSVVLVNPSAWISLREIGVGNLKGYLREGVAVHWNREGETRVIPVPVLINALRLYRDAMKLVNADRLAAVSEAVHVIRWEQTEPLPQTNMVFNPTVTIRQQSSGGGGVDGPA